jgi:type 1 glutamine amidotransferase
MRVKAELATLLWMPMNEQKERGIGYYKYAIGKLGYTTGFNKIQFIIGGVYKSRPTNTSVQSVKYTLYISNSRELLQQGVMCTKSMKEKLFSIQVNSSKVGDMQPPEIAVDLEVNTILCIEKENN